MFALDARIFREDGKSDNVLSQNTVPVRVVVIDFAEETPLASRPPVPSSAMYWQRFKRDIAAVWSVVAKHVQAEIKVGADCATNWGNQISE
jgi:hypothetical protein